jgi:hypothetical protein
MILPLGYPPTPKAKSNPKDPEEIKRRIAAHTEIWELKEDAVAGNSVEENVAKIAEYVEDADMRSTAVQALGEIGHPSAAPALIKLLRGHLDVVGTDHDFQMKHHKPSFWAPQAAGSINYTGAGKYYNKVESIFFRMSASPRPGTMLAHGMTLMGTTRFRNALKNGLEIPGVHNARAMATMGDVSFLRPAYLQALSEENERDFAELLWTVELIGLTDRGFANRGMNKSEVFTNLLITAFKKFSVAGATLNFDPFGKDSIPAPNSDILTSLMSLKPKTCK